MQPTTVTIDATVSRRGAMREAEKLD